MMKIKKAPYSYVVLAILLILILASGYYLYRRQRSSAIVYVTASLVRPQTIALNVPFNWVPYWVGKSIDIGDHDVSPLGGDNAVVIDKEAVESLNFGQIVSLLLKVRAVRDRTGVYLYKNKPLAVGSLLDLKLTKTQATAYVTYIGIKPPDEEFAVVRLVVKGRLLEAVVANGIKIGDIIKNSKDKIIAKIVDKKESAADLRIDTAANISAFLNERQRRDVDITIDVLAKKSEDTYFFADSQRLKAGENFFISFPSTTLNYQIIKTEVLKDESL